MNTTTRISTAERLGRTLGRGWRAYNGEAGFGLYSSNGQRLDPHDPNDPFDD